MTSKLKQRGIKEICSRFFCWKTAVGYIERKFVQYERYFVCQKHGEKDMEVWEKASWEGTDWHTQEFISFKGNN